MVHLEAALLARVCDDLGKWLDVGDSCNHGANGDKLQGTHRVTPDSWMPILDAVRNRNLAWKVAETRVASHIGMGAVHESGKQTRMDGTRMDCTRMDGT